jgi:hypothetical protein
VVIEGICYDQLVQEDVSRDYDESRLTVTVTVAVTVTVTVTVTGYSYPEGI